VQLVGERPLQEILKFTKNRDRNAKPVDAITALDTMLKEVRSGHHTYTHTHSTRAGPLVYIHLTTD
jgi:hypothetical protein